jgi:hypothetical protein
MDRTGAPPGTWLLCITYVCFILNHTFNIKTGNVPLTHLTGTTVLLRFYFWQKVYYKAVESDFPTKSTEVVGHIVGISEHCGHALTWKILAADTNISSICSLVRPFLSDDANLCAEMLGGKDFKEDNLQGAPIIELRYDYKSSKHVSTELDSVDQEQSKLRFVFNPEELVSRTFVMDQHDDGQQVSARIVKLIKDHQCNIDKIPSKLKFLFSINYDHAE